MRKLVAILFLLILPLQWTTAAVAAYCQHEMNKPAQQHLGHHAHEHHAVAASTVDNSSGNSSAHSDCPFCHAHLSQAIFVSAQTLLPASGGGDVIPYRAVLPDTLPESPFRPPMSRPA